MSPSCFDWMGIRSPPPPLLGGGGIPEEIPKECQLFLCMVLHRKKIDGIFPKKKCRKLHFCLIFWMGTFEFVLLVIWWGVKRAL